MGQEGNHGWLGEVGIQGVALAGERGEWAKSADLVTMM